MIKQFLSWIYCKEGIAETQTDTSMFIAVLFTIVKYFTTKEMLVMVNKKEEGEEATFLHFLKSLCISYLKKSEFLERNDSKASFLGITEKDLKDTFHKLGQGGNSQYKTISQILK